MPDLNYNVGVETNTGIKNLDRLNNSVRNTNNEFVKFRSTLGTVSLAAFAVSAYTSADAITDLGAASGLGTQYVIGLTRAFETAGGSAETAQIAIGRIGQSIQAALQDPTSQAAKNFAALGFSIEELAGTSDKVTLNKLIERLGTGERSAVKMAAAMDLAGKGVASVNFSQVNATLGANIDRAGGQVAAYNAAGQAADSFRSAVNTLQGLLLVAIKPLSDLVNRLKEFDETTGKISNTIGTFLGWVAKIGAVLAAVAAVFATVAGAIALFGSGVGEVGAAAVGFGAMIARAGGILSSFGRTFGSIWTQIKALTTAILEGGVVFEEFGTFLRLFAEKRLPWLGKAFGETAVFIKDNWKALVIFLAGAATAIGDSFDWIKEKLGFSTDIKINFKPGSKEDLERIQKTKDFLQADAEKALAEIAAKQKLADEARSKDQDKLLNSTQQATLQLDQQFQSYKDINAEQLLSLQNQTEINSLNEKDRAGRQALIQFDQSYRNTTLAFLKQEKTLREQISNIDIRLAEYKKANPQKSEIEFNADPFVKGLRDQKAAAESQLPIVRKELDATTEEYKKNRDEIEKGGVAAWQSAFNQAKAQEFIKFSIDSQIKSQNDLISLQDDMAKMTMTEIEKKYYDIDAAAKASAKSQVDSLNQQQILATGIAMSEQERLALTEEYYQKASAGNAKIKAQMQLNYDESRKFSTGWTKAFNDYKEAATDAAKNAQTIFQKATQGMEDAIVNFAKTGKFEWKSFVSSIVEELLRQQVRELIAKTFGGLGLGNQTNGGVFGNNNSGMGSSGGGGLLSVIGGLLGFAGGGTIPTNGPVLVGERGPELLMNAGGSRVVPNNQLGGTTVVYNINAVDAMSFKQMVARDPSFIYAVSQQGAKSIPSTRR